MSPKKSKPARTSPAKVNPAKSIPAKANKTVPSTVVVSCRATAALRDKLAETQTRLGHKNVAETVLKALTDYVERKRAR